MVGSRVALFSAGMLAAGLLAVSELPSDPHRHAFRKSDNAAAESGRRAAAAIGVTPRR
jgi:hypothetical protein